MLTPAHDSLRGVSYRLGRIVAERQDLENPIPEDDRSDEATFEIKLSADLGDDLIRVDITLSRHNWQAEIAVTVGGYFRFQPGKARLPEDQLEEFIMQGAVPRTLQVALAQIDLASNQIGADLMPLPFDLERRLREAPLSVLVSDDEDTPPEEGE